MAERAIFIGGPLEGSVCAIFAAFPRIHVAMFAIEHADDEPDAWRPLAAADYRRIRHMPDLVAVYVDGAEPPAEQVAAMIDEALDEVPLGVEEDGAA